MTNNAPGSTANMIKITGSACVGGYFGYIEATEFDALTILNNYAHIETIAKGVDATNTISGYVGGIAGCLNGSLDMLNGISLINYGDINTTANSVNVSAVGGLFGYC